MEGKTSWITIGILIFGIAGIHHAQGRRLSDLVIGDDGPVAAKELADEKIVNAVNIVPLGANDEIGEEPNQDSVPEEKADSIGESAKASSEGIPAPIDFENETAQFDGSVPEKNADSVDCKSPNASSEEESSEISSNDPFDGSDEDSQIAFYAQHLELKKVYMVYEPVEDQIDE